MNIYGYMTCLNNALLDRYENAKGRFICRKYYKEVKFPIYKNLIVEIYYIEPDLLECVFEFSFLDRVSDDKLQLEFEDKCTMVVVSTITSQIDKIWKYGNRSK